MSREIHVLDKAIEALKQIEKDFSPPLVYLEWGTHYITWTVQGATDPTPFPHVFMANDKITVTFSDHE